MIVQKLLAIVNLGAAWVLWLLIGLSVVSVGIMIERGAFFLGRRLPNRDALAGWKKERARPDETVHEYTRAVEMFIQLHGNLAIVAIKRRHALEFRAADAEIHTKSALMLARLARLAEAQSELESALKLNPNFAPAKQLLQDVLSHLKQE